MDKYGAPVVVRTMSAMPEQRRHQLREDLKRRQGELQYDLQRNEIAHLRIRAELIRTEDALQEIEADMNEYERER